MTSRQLKDREIGLSANRPVIVPTPKRSRS